MSTTVEMPALPGKNQKHIARKGGWAVRDPAGLYLSIGKADGQVIEIMCVEPLLNFNAQTPIRAKLQIRISDELRGSQVLHTLYEGPRLTVETLTRRIVVALSAEFNAVEDSSSEYSFAPTADQEADADALVGLIEDLAKRPRTSQLTPDKVQKPITRSVPIAIGLAILVIFLDIFCTQKIKSEIHNASSKQTPKIAALQPASLGPSEQIVPPSATTNVAVTSLTTSQAAKVGHDPYGIPDVLAQDIWVKSNGKIPLPMPGGGTLTSPDDLKDFGLKP